MTWLMDMLLAKPTGRRVRCPACGNVVAEVGPESKPQVAHHWTDDGFRCRGFGMPSDKLKEAKP